MLSQFSSERIDSKRFNVENSLRLCITSLNLDSLHVIPSHCSTFAMQGLFFFFSSSSPVFLAGRDLFPHGIQSPSDYPAIDVITSIKMPREKKKQKQKHGPPFPDDTPLYPTQNVSALIRSYSRSVSSIPVQFTRRYRW